MKAAVIGCGAQGRGGHVANYARMDDVELVAVCDVNLERAQAVAEEFNVPHVYSDYREVGRNRSVSGDSWLNRFFH